jgi:hypothetical protein
MVPRNTKPNVQDCHTVRRIAGISLILLYWLGPLLSLMPASDESRLPACCRRHGAHHCMMNMAERAALEGGEVHFAAPASKCPYYPANLRTAHTQASFSLAVFSVNLPPVSHPTGVAQSESKRRISCDRSRQKRGPPLTNFL